MIRIAGLAGVMAAVLGTGAPARAAEPSLYERLGGMPAIRAVVDGTLANVLRDDRIKGWFAWAVEPRAAQGYKTALADLVCQSTGGPCRYQGADLKTVHRGLGVTRQAFDAMVEDIAASLDQLKVPAAERNELLGLLAPLQGQIVEQ